MGGSHLGRAEYSRRNAVAHALQCRDEGAELPVEIPHDVLAEDTTRPHLFDDSQHMVEQPPVIGATSALPRDTVGLARVARSDAIHNSTPRSAVEGGKVTPDRRRM